MFSPPGGERRAPLVRLGGTQRAQRRATAYLKNLFGKVFRPTTGTSRSMPVARRALERTSEGVDPIGTTSLFGGYGGEGASRRLLPVPVARSNTVAGSGMKDNGVDIVDRENLTVTLAIGKSGTENLSSSLSYRRMHVGVVMPSASPGPRSETLDPSETSSISTRCQQDNGVEE